MFTKLLSTKRNSTTITNETTRMIFSSFYFSIIATNISRASRTSFFRCTLIMTFSSIIQLNEFSNKRIVAHRTSVVITITIFALSSTIYSKKLSIDASVTHITVETFLMKFSIKCSDKISLNLATTTITVWFIITSSLYRTF